MVEIASVVFLGILAQWLAWKTRVPAILPLIILGLVVGPLAEYLLGHKIIEPTYDAAEDIGLFAGGNLFYFVSLSIGIILFEGGLTLKFSEFKGIGNSIVNLISVGSLITFLGAGFATIMILGISPELAFLFAGLIIVTGPTVIAPILRNVPLNRNVANILKWEGILIDPIGALVAVLAYEFIVSNEGQLEYTQMAFLQFIRIVIIGMGLGISAGWGVVQLLKREMIPHYLLTVSVLAAVLGVFVLSDALAHESGLLTVVVMGMVIGNMNAPHLEDILYFKESLTILLISVLFILLSANIDFEDLMRVAQPKYGYLFLVIVFILRPLGVFASTMRSNLSLNEKLFISWVGPRGIVAAGIASLFGLSLTKQGVPGAEILTPLVFLIVLGTVLLNATTARWVAKKLKVTLDSSNGLLIVGANIAPRLIAKYLQDNGRRVVVLDSSKKNIEEAQKEGLEALQANIYNDDLRDRFELLDVGYLMAMTGSDDVNAFAVKQLSGHFGEEGTYRLITQKETKTKDIEAFEESVLFSENADFFNLNKLAKEHPIIHEIAIDTKEALQVILEKMNTQFNQPLFIKSDGQYKLVTINEDIEVKEGDMLIYIGKGIEE